MEVGSEPGLSRNQVFNVLRAIMPESAAKKLAGYSEGTGSNQLHRYDGTVAEIREKIQSDPSFGFMRQLEFYSGIRDNQDEVASDRIAAAKQIDVVAGYNAPAKVEVNDRRTLVAAVRVLHQVRNETGMSPLELKKMLGDRSLVGPVEMTVVSEAPVLSEEGGNK